jgi:hypothetical protein
VGDGGVVYVTARGTATQPPTGNAAEFSGEVQHFLPDDGSVDALRQSLAVHDASTVDSVVLATDGVEDPWYPLERHAPLLVRSIVTDAHETGLAADVQRITSVSLAPASRTRDAGDALLAWLAFEKRGENDDRTLLLARRLVPTAR